MVRGYTRNSHIQTCTLTPILSHSISISGVNASHALESPSHESRKKRGKRKNKSGELFDAFVVPHTWRSFAMEIKTKELSIKHKKSSLFSRFSSLISGSMQRNHRLVLHPNKRYKSIHSSIYAFYFHPAENFIAFFFFYFFLSHLQTF